MSRVHVPAIMSVQALVVLTLVVTSLTRDEISFSTLLVGEAEMEVGYAHTLHVWEVMLHGWLVPHSFSWCFSCIASLPSFTVQATAEGLVVDSAIVKGQGGVADVLVTWGKLKPKDVVVAGTEYGKVRG